MLGLVGFSKQLRENMLTGSEALLERNAVLQSPQRIEELIKIFIHATKVREIS